MSFRTFALFAVCCATFVLRAEAVKSFGEDERAALRFLDFVSAPMSAADEKEWWDFGGRQFGLFATLAMDLTRARPTHGD